MIRLAMPEIGEEEVQAAADAVRRAIDSRSSR